jgi:Mrp family chromosome partitioning ATPase
VNPDRGPSEAPTVADYVRVLRRRAPVVALVVALGLALGVAYVRSSDELHEASAKVLLSRGSPAATLAGVTGLSDRGDPERFVQTQAEIGRTEAVARAVLAAEDLHDRTPGDLMAAREVLIGGSADVLEFRVRDPNPEFAVRLAGQFAAQFTVYQRKLDKTALDQARSEIRTRLETLRRQGAGATDSRVYRELLAQERKLLTAEPLEAGKALVLSAPTSAVQVRPRPKTDLAVAFAASLLLGVLAAFLLEGLDRRLDSATAIARRLRLPFLGQVASLGASPGARMTSLAGSAGRQAEDFQLLRRNIEASLEAAGLDRPGGVIAFTSSRPTDGKSATVANLALAFALAGRQVILVELDASHRGQRVFDIPAGAGVTELAEGSTTVDDALVYVRTGGRDLGVLPLGNAVHSLNALLASDKLHLASDRLAGVVEQLRARADLVLIDAPPLLGANGALQVAAHADGLVLVLRLSGARDRVLARVASLLLTSGPVKLGFIGTDASPGITGGPAHALPAAAPADPAAGASDLNADADGHGHRGPRGRSERSRA